MECSLLVECPAYHTKLYLMVILFFWHCGKCGVTCCDEEIWHPHTFARFWGKEVWHASYQTMIIVSRISSGKRGCLSSTLCISTSWHGHGRTLLPISHVCINGEADLRPWLVLRKKLPKSQQVVNFQTMETRQLPFIRPRVKTHKELPLFIEKLRT